jgi:hypothetical protein
VGTIGGIELLFEGKAARLLSLRKDRGHTMEVELPRVQEKKREKLAMKKERKERKVWALHKHTEIQPRGP